MYDDLVKSLRICGDSVDAIDECCFEECIQHERPIDPMCMQALCNKAADAIEELTATAESYKRSMEAWADEATRAHEMMPRWIPVAERLPDIGSNCLIFSVSGWVAEGQFDGDGWTQYRWSAKFDKDAVTHWVPLPEPPKESI